jgi:hypothetical protein
VDGLGALVQCSRNFHLLSGERLGFLLVVQLVEPLGRCVEQNVFTTHLHTGLSTRFRVGGAFFLKHCLVPPALGTLAVHDLAAEGLVLRCRETGRQQHTRSDTHYQFLHFFVLRVELLLEILSVPVAVGLRHVADTWREPADASSKLKVQLLTNIKDCLDFIVCESFLLPFSRISK